MDTKMNVKKLVVGKTYTRLQISKAVGGGELQTYLPEYNGRILAGCFDPGLNLRAPHEVDVGEGVKVIAKAETVASAQTAIPVFLKRGAGAWEYVGLYKCLCFSRERRHIRAYKDRRGDAVGVLYFEAIKDDDAPIPDIELLETRATEGRSIYITHLAKERKRGLIFSKRSEVRKKNGCLICEACKLKESDLPEPIAEACFEIHHRTPLATLTKETQTTLTDLAMLCANCHRMIHRTSPMLTVRRLAERLN